MFVAAFRLLNSSLTNLSRLFHCLIFKVLNFCRSLRQLYNFINYFPSCQELFLFSFAPSFTERYTSYHVWTSLSTHFLMFFVAHQAVSLYILSSILRCVNHIFYIFLSFLFLSSILTICSIIDFLCHNLFCFLYPKNPMIYVILVCKLWLYFNEKNTSVSEAAHYDRINKSEIYSDQ